MDISADPNHPSNKPQTINTEHRGEGKHKYDQAIEDRWGASFSPLGQKKVDLQRAKRIVRLTWEWLLNGVFPPLTRYHLGPMS